MKVKHSMSAPTAWLLLFLAGDIQTRHASVGVTAFVPSPISSTPTTSKFGYRFMTLGAKAQDEEEEPRLQDESNRNIKNNNNLGVGRRETLMTLLGSAVSFAVGDLALNAAVKATGAAGTAVVTAGGGLYERVLAFGNQYRGAAIASEELTTWIAAQSVAATPEIRAWLAAQQKLQMVRKATMAATAAVTRAKTTKKAAAVGGGIMEEGVLAAAATAAVKLVSSAKDDISSRDTTPTALEASSATQDGEGEILIPSSKDNDLTKTPLASTSVEMDRLSASASSTDGNGNEDEAS